MVRRYDQRERRNNWQIEIEKGFNDLSNCQNESPFTTETGTRGEAPAVDYDQLQINNEGFQAEIAELAQRLAGLQKISSSVVAKLIWARNPPCE
jgi:hypothetical protein